MPYTYFSPTTQHSLGNAKWYPAVSLAALNAYLVGVDFSVVEQRRRAHERVMQFESEGIPGTMLFGNRRFPADVTYVTSYDVDVRRNILALTSTLSWRSTAENPRVGAPGGPIQPMSVASGSFNAYSDNAKRYEETCNSLASHTTSLFWDRYRFESYATWTEPEVMQQQQQYLAIEAPPVAVNTGVDVNMMNQMNNNIVQMGQLLANLTATIANMNQQVNANANTTNQAVDTNQDTQDQGAEDEDNQTGEADEADAEA